MDNAKVDEVLRDIVSELRQMGHEPHRLSGGELLPGRLRALNHAMALAVVALDMPAERLEKKFRWLGFIQGVLWSFGISSIDDLKAANMCDEPRS